MKVHDFDPDQPAALWPAKWKSIQNAGSLTFEGRHRRKDGAIVPVAITANYSMFDGKEYGFAFVQDISSRKSAEAALAEQKHLFDILMENVPDQIYFKDRQSRFIRISKAQATLFDLTDAAEAVGKTDFDFFSDTHARQAFEAEREILRTGQPMLGSVEKETWSDGRERWVATSRLPLSDRAGQIVGTFGISRNITRSKLAEQALRASEEFNKRVLESSSDGVCVLDLHGSVLYVSTGGRNLLELDDTGTVPALNWLSLWAGVDRQKSESALLDAVSGGVGAYQGSLRTTKGKPKLWDIVISPITGSNGAIERLVCVFRDITERRLLESQLSQAQKLESIGQLAAGIAHEINTPIQYIGDNGKFLEEAFQDLTKVIHSMASAGGQTPPDLGADVEYLQEEIPKAIAQLLEGVQHVADIVRAMKEFSHPGPLEKTPVDINRAIAGTILVSRNEWKYIADLATDFDRDLPKVSCIAGEINQVVLNLIVNAAHAIGDVVHASGHKGSIRISTRRNGDWAEIRVSDTGPGIPEAIQAKVFDPFFTTKPVGKGTGQGLSIAHAVVVQKHRGAISFESVAGKGTTFLIQLPLEPRIEET
jgi:PAS domain S-box-containing protein